MVVRVVVLVLLSRLMQCIHLGWLVVVATALATSSANVYGYYKCSSDQKAKFQQMMTQGAQAGAMTVMRSNVLGWLTGSSNTP